MEINLDFDDELLKKYEARKASPFFGIALQQDNQFYPSEDWNDFGAVILNWWIGTMLHLLSSGRCKEFLFMDGPYEVKVRYRRSTKMMELRPQGLDVIWQVSPRELTEAIVNAAEKVIQKLAQMNTGKVEREGLERAVSKLRELSIQITPVIYNS
jgi:hypothetical protein